MAWKLDNRSIIWIMLLTLVLGSNLVLYRSPFTDDLLTGETNWVIIGSLIDLAIISPLLLIAISKKDKFSVPKFIILMAGGLILARYLIPMRYFEPFAGISYVGFAIEGIVFLLELSVVFMIFRYLPSVIRESNASENSLLFAFQPILEKKIRKHPVIKIIASELVMGYYAFFSWKNSPPAGREYYSLHKNSSLVAFQIMMIHAIIIETIGIHWWLHDKSLLLSILLLIMNIYTVIFFIGDIQAVRLNPVRLTDRNLYLSLGLAKKMTIPLEDIASISMGRELLERKQDTKTTIEFVAKDFETVYPHIILELNNPCRATFFMGIEKKYTRVALRLDDPKVFHEALLGHGV